MVTKNDTPLEQKKAEAIIRKFRKIEVEGYVKNSGGILGDYTRFQLDGDAVTRIRAELTSAGIDQFLKDNFPHLQIEDEHVWCVVDGFMRINNGLYAKAGIVNYPASNLDRQHLDAKSAVLVLDRDYHFSPKPSEQYGIPVMVRDERFYPVDERRNKKIRRLYFVVDSLTLFDNKDSKQPLSGPFMRENVSLE